MERTASNFRVEQEAKETSIMKKAVGKSQFGVSRDGAVTMRRPGTAPF